MKPDDAARDTWWAGVWLSIIFVIAIGLLLLLLGPFHLAGGNTNRLTAILAFIGVLVTAAVSLVGLTLTRQSNRRLTSESADQDSRLRLDAAMRAGESFTSSTSKPVAPASIASSLLALTKLESPDLAVALLVDFWSPQTRQSPLRLQS